MRIVCLEASFKGLSALGNLREEKMGHGPRPTAHGNRGRKHRRLVGVNFSHFLKAARQEVKCEMRDEEIEMG